MKRIASLIKFSFAGLLCVFAQNAAACYSGCPWYDPDCLGDGGGPGGGFGAVAPKSRFASFAGRQQCGSIAQNRSPAFGTTKAVNFYTTTASAIKVADTAGSEKLDVKPINPANPAEPRVAKIFQVSVSRDAILAAASRDLALGRAIAGVVARSNANRFFSGKGGHMFLAPRSVAHLSDILNGADPAPRKGDVSTNVTYTTAVSDSGALVMTMNIESLGADNAVFNQRSYRLVMSGGSISADGTPVVQLVSVE